MTAMTDRFAPKGMRGREHEQSTVRDLLRRVARGGGGGVVLVEGEPGTGKSRLLREVAAEATGDGFSLAAGVADQLGQTIPLFALRAALGEPFARFTAGRDDQDPRQSPDW
jgi:predicted ATPase